MEVGRPTHRNYLDEHGRLDMNEVSDWVLSNMVEIKPGETSDWAWIIREPSSGLMVHHAEAIDMFSKDIAVIEFINSNEARQTIRYDFLTNRYTV